MKIFINGGLGNQLFQYCFSHCDNKGIRVYLDFEPRADRPFELKNLIANCKHGTTVAKSNQIFLNIRIKISRIPVKLKLNFLRNVFAKITQINIESKVFSFLPLTDIDKNSLNMGYFQHWKNVVNNWKSFGNELITYLDLVDIPSNLNQLPSNTVVIHVRQGDLINVKNSMGILDYSYYSRAINKIKEMNENSDFNFIILTDDIKRANDIVVQLKLINFSILGPDQLNAWQSLKVMSNAKNLISANSTLSWWGAFIASDKGGKSYLPTPWFKNWHEDVDDAFYFPGCNIVLSNFL
jgi:hypothetical protein